MDEKIKALVNVYRAAAQRLIELVLVKAPNGNALKYELLLLRQIDAQIKKLNAASADWAMTAIPSTYQDALDEVDRLLKAAGLTTTTDIALGETALASLHTAAVEGVVTNTIESMITANNYIGRQWRDVVRKAGLEATAEKFATGATWKAMQKNLQKKLVDNKITAVPRKGGGIIQIDSYAELVARSTTAETTNRATLNQLTGKGYDLVKMTTHSPTCSVCAPLQGRVYSISGKDHRYPPLTKAHSGIYANIHPNCRHRIYPWVKDRFSDAESTADVAEAQRFSGKPFEDNRGSEEKAKYNEAARKRAELREDRKQYLRIRAAIGENAPKTFSSFRNIKKNHKEAYNKLLTSYRQRDSDEKVG